MITQELQEFISKQAEYVFEPEKWAFDILQFKADKWQSQQLKAFIDHHFVCWSAGSGVGKSALLGVIILFFLATRPFPRIPCTAPTQHQLFDVLWANISKWQRRSPLLEKMFKWTQTKVALKGHEAEWYAVARTSKPRPGQTAAEGLQGFHEGNILFVIDEASGVPDQVMMAVDGSLTTSGAYAIMASNPTRRSGYFFKALTDPTLKEVWHPATINAEDAIHADKAAIQRAVKIYGKNSYYYRVKVLGLPPLSETEGLITPEQIYAAHDRIIEPKGIKVLSCDPARFGNDNTVFYYREGNAVLKRWEVGGLDTMLVAKMAFDIMTEYDPNIVSVDTIGIGSGVADRIRQLLREPDNAHMSAQVLDVVVGEKARDLIVNGKVISEEKKFFNLRSQLFYYLRTVIDVISLPADTDFLDEELQVIKYGWDHKDAKIKVDSKDIIKANLPQQRSPNDADSLAILFANDIINFMITISDEYFKISGVDKLSHLDTPGTTTSDSIIGEGRGGFVSSRLSSSGLSQQKRWN